MEVSLTEIISLIPLLLLAIIYWIRDKYLYNRGDGTWYRFTNTQIKVILFAYPSWVFLEWTGGLQTSRTQSLLAILTTTGKHVVGHYTTIGMLNDTFRMTQQQFVSMFIGLFISYTWTVFWLIMSQNKVNDISNNNCTCN